MPAHLATREFFALVRCRLADGGVLHMNLIVSPRRERLAARIDRTLRFAFAWCAAEAVGDPSWWHNRVYSCPRSALDGDDAVYSDANASGDMEVRGR